MNDTTCDCQKRKATQGARLGFRSSVLIAVVAAVLSLSVNPLQAQEPPSGAKPLSAWELVLLFGNKTWLWPNVGGGYFARDRSFTGRTEAGGVVSRADGRWLVTDSGKLCIKAIWKTGDQAEPSLTCFEHMKDGGDIYQRNLVGGDWYVFKHSTVEDEDEYNRLVRGNQILNEQQS